jgi:hypothetical protein
MSTRSEQLEDLVLLGKAAFTLLREEELPVTQDVELALRAFGDRGGDALVVQDGRETRGPAVVAASDGAVLDLDGHARSLPWERRRGARDDRRQVDGGGKRPVDAARLLEPRAEGVGGLGRALTEKQRALERDREQLE